MTTIYIKDGKEFNLWGEKVIDGVLCPHGFFSDPQVREQFGITEYQLPDPPAEYDPTFWTIAAIEDAPYRKYEKKDDATCAAIKNEQTKQQIAALEDSQARCIREATLTGDKTRLTALDAQITELRNQLIKDAQGWIVGNPKPPEQPMVTNG